VDFYLFLSLIKKQKLQRSIPITPPIDYEKFVLERAGQLERDKDRDLMLFARDDFSVLFYCFLWN
jgi:hypothetical protein